MTIFISLSTPAEFDEEKYRHQAGCLIYTPSVTVDHERRTLFHALAVWISSGHRIQTWGLPIFSIEVALQIRVFRG
jgi:hypothetical protein